MKRSLWPLASQVGGSYCHLNTCKTERSTHALIFFDCRRRCYPSLRWWHLFHQFCPRTCPSQRSASRPTKSWITWQSRCRGQVMIRSAEFPHQLWSLALVQAPLCSRLISCNINAQDTYIVSKNCFSRNSKPFFSRNCLFLAVTIEDSRHCGFAGACRHHSFLDCIDFPRRLWFNPGEQLTFKRSQAPIHFTFSQSVTCCLLLLDFLMYFGLLPLKMSRICPSWIRCASVIGCRYFIWAKGRDTLIKIRLPKRVLYWERQFVYLFGTTNVGDAILEQCRHLSRRLALCTKSTSPTFFLNLPLRKGKQTAVRNRLAI